jgi:glycosyltransferase involved in cell wall biosynthesis
MKKTILHFIYNLGRGGAEVMMVKVTKELKEYNNIVVTIFPQNHFGNELTCDKFICLNLRSLLFLPVAAFRLRKIIKENKVDVVHTHLFWPTIIGRLGTPAKIPLITTIHAFIGSSIEYKQAYVRILDKITYHLRKTVIIAVAKGATNEYFSFLKLKPYKAFSLYTFVDTKQFNISRALPVAREGGKFRLISVGALRIQKNHKFLLEAFKKLVDEDFELDIYGEGPLDKELQHLIDQNNLKVNLKGEVHNLEGLINQYDLFVMSSTFEGFSLSVLEAMAMEMPLLLSDIKSFREQCADTASYFALDNVEDFITKIKTLVADKNKLRVLGSLARERALNNFTLDKHMDGLRRIYQQVI